MMQKDRTIIEMLELWFEDKQNLSKTNYDMIKKMYWLATKRGIK